MVQIDDDIIHINSSCWLLNEFIYMYIYIIYIYIYIYICNITYI